MLAKFLVVKLPLNRSPLWFTVDSHWRSGDEVKKIVLVDDSPFFISALQDLLSDHEFLVSTASSGEEAINQLLAAENSDPFDLLITDLVMPGMSGYELAEFMREKNKKSKFTPVIMMTEQDITKEDAREHGCAAYVPKNNLKKVLSMARILLTRFD